jgi:hypothetical protein
VSVLKLTAPQKRIPRDEVAEAEGILTDAMAEVFQVRGCALVTMARVIARMSMTSRADGAELPPRA